MSTEIKTQDPSSLLTESNFEHAYRMASMVSKSSLVPKAYFDKPHDVLICMEMGRGLGLNPLQALQNIAVINGKPSLYGDAVLAVCQGHPEFENISEEPIIDGSKTIGYVCTVKRRNREAVVQSFTIEDAQAAGIWGRTGPWKQYPKRMLQMRARGFALRDCFADALGGVRVAEEVVDYPTAKEPTKKGQDMENELLGKIQVTGEVIKGDNNA